jgi:sterol desaturase/sphingolipid hydroxylase (fatty acid hydroxylase superfamily)
MNRLADDMRALADAITSLGPAGRITLACYLLIGVAVVIEVTALRINGGRARSLAITISVALVLGMPLAWVTALLWSWLETLAPSNLVQTWRAAPALAALACFVVVDAVPYLYHWAGHHTRIGWASHRVHHLGETFDMTLVLRQPWLPLHGLAIVPLTALAGFPFGIAAACTSISIAYQALQHTSRSWTAGPFERVVVSGRTHRRHHVVECGAVNLGTVFNVWDKALGTWSDEPVGAHASYGVGEPEPQSPIEAQLDGWRRTRRRSEAASAR